MFTKHIMKKRSKNIYSNEEGRNAYGLEGQSHSDINSPKAICNVIYMGFTVAINIGEWIHCSRRKLIMSIKVE